MSFISYAQNYEDVTLYRALRGVSRGFYIDVGANDPINDSVTFAFYQRGWRGINIEPSAHWHARLQAERPEDINLQIAIADAESNAVLHDIPGTGLGTLVAELAQAHQARGLTVETASVLTRTLSAVCEAHGVTEIHFLKIDVEGAEGAVLRGLDLRRWRPWVVVAEATAPNSTEQTHAAWEDILTSQGYHFVYFDGLNRFYVAAEHQATLAPALALPPNLFDQIVRHADAQIHQRADALAAAQARSIETQALTDAELVQTRKELAAAQLQAQERLHSVQATLYQCRQDVARLHDIIAHERANTDRLHNRVAALEHELHRTLQSLSWRLTEPLRQGKLLVNRLAGSVLRAPRDSVVRRGGRALLGTGLAVARAVPAIKPLIARAASLHPALDAHLRGFARAHRQKSHTLYQSNQYHLKFPEKRREHKTTLRKSSSWRVTPPLRWISERIRRFTDRDGRSVEPKLRSRPRKAVSSALFIIRNWIQRRPRLAILIRKIFRRFPGFRTRLALIANGNSVSNASPYFDNLPVKDHPSSDRGCTEEKNSSHYTKYTQPRQFIAAGLPDHIADWWAGQQTTRNEPDAQTVSSVSNYIKILQITTYDVDTLDHGGKLRSYHIRRALRSRFEVETLSFEWSDVFDSSTKAVALDKRKWEALGIDGNTSDWGICTYLKAETDCYKKIVDLVIDYSPSAILLEQPFLWPLVERLIREGIVSQDIALIYSSHNIETDLKLKIYRDSYPPKVATEYIRHVNQIEECVIRECTSALAVSPCDAVYIKSLSPKKPVRVYSNGHSPLQQRPTDKKWRKNFASQSRNWVFVGSWHPPNINGLCDFVSALKRREVDAKNISLWVLGSAGNALVSSLTGFREKDYPWLHIVGPVPSDDIESAIMCSSGVVLPIWEGSGSNLKTAQALLSGKCILGSEFSFRGFERFVNEAGIELATDADGLARLFVETEPQERYFRTERVKALSWDSVLESLPTYIDNILLRKREQTGFSIS